MYVGIETDVCYHSPFVQRVWISLEAKGLQYQYVEVDPYKKPESLLEINPRGLVPALRHGDFGIGESTVIMEYVGVPHRVRFVHSLMIHSSRI